MFERFTERARQTVQGAQDFARDCRATHITSGHILRALYEPPGGEAEENPTLAQKALWDVGMNPDTVDKIALLMGEIEGAPDGELEEVEQGQIAFTDPCKKCLELALREALSLGHNYIGPEHILLGLARMHDEPRVLALIDPPEVRESVIRQLTGRERKRVEVIKEYLVIPAECYRRVRATTPGEAMRLAAEEWPEDLRDVLIAMPTKADETWRGLAKHETSVNITGVEKAA